MKEMYMQMSLSTLLRSLSWNCSVETVCGQNSSPGRKHITYVTIHLRERIHRRMKDEGWWGNSGKASRPQHHLEKSDSKSHSRNIWSVLSILLLLMTLMINNTSCEDASLLMLGKDSSLLLLTRVTLTKERKSESCSRVTIVSWKWESQ